MAKRPRHVDEDTDYESVKDLFDRLQKLNTSMDKIFVMILHKVYEQDRKLAEMSEKLDHITELLEGIEEEIEETEE